MRVGVIQSNYIPWRGYFDFIASVNLFVIYDDVQYSKGSWRNRNCVKTPTGLQWITVPINVHLGMLIDEVPIADLPVPWKEKQRKLLTESLGTSAFFGDAMRIWDESIKHGDVLLSALNVRLIKAICAYLRIATPIVFSRDYRLVGEKTARLIDLLTKVGATAYLSGPSAKSYLDENQFRKHRIRLEYKSYDYSPYPQPWGNFEGGVTILDLIANTGPDACKYLASTISNKVVSE